MKTYYKDSITNKYGILNMSISVLGNICSLLDFLDMFLSEAFLSTFIKQARRSCLGIEDLRSTDGGRKIPKSERSWHYDDLVRKRIWV